MRQLDRIVRTVAGEDVVVTFTGESGAGKGWGLPHSGHLGGGRLLSFVDGTRGQGADYLQSPGDTQPRLISIDDRFG